MSAKDNAPKFSIKTGSPEKLRSDCVVAGVFEEHKLTAAARALDKASGGRISAALKSGDMDGSASSLLMLRDLPGIATARVLLVGLGKQAELSEKTYRDAVAAAVKAAAGTAAKDTLIALDDIKVGKRAAEWNIAQAAIVAGEALYRFGLRRASNGGRVQICQTAVHRDIQVKVRFESDVGIQGRAERQG